MAFEDTKGGLWHPQRPSLTLPMTAYEASGEYYRACKLPISVIPTDIFTFTF